MPGREPPNPPPEMPAWSPRLHIRGGPSCLLRFNGLHPTTLLVAWRRPGGGGGEGRPERSRCSDPAAAAAQRRPVSRRARPCAQRERLPGRPDFPAGPCEPAPLKPPAGGRPGYEPRDPSRKEGSLESGGSAHPPPRWMRSKGHRRPGTCRWRRDRTIDPGTDRQTARSRQTGADADAWSRRLPAPPTPPLCAPLRGWAACAPASALTSRSVGRPGGATPPRRGAQRPARPSGGRRGAQSSGPRAGRAGAGLGSGVRAWPSCPRLPAPGSRGSARPTSPLRCARVSNRRRRRPTL